MNHLLKAEIYKLKTKEMKSGFEIRMTVTDDITEGLPSSSDTVQSSSSSAVIGYLRMRYCPVSTATETVGGCFYLN